MDWRSLPIVLELSDVLWKDNGEICTARHGATQVKLALTRKGVQVDVTLSSPAPFEQACARGRDLRLDEVSAGDPAFDQAVRVTAEEWNREGTRRALASPAIVKGLRSLIAIHGEASATRLTVTLPGAPTDAQIKTALHVELELAAALALLAHERRDPAPAAPAPAPLRAPTRRAPVQEEEGETAVDEWAPSRFRLHNPWLRPSTLELDLIALTLQTPGAAPIQIGRLFVTSHREPTASSLNRRRHDGTTLTVCTGRLRSIESLVRALERLGIST